MFKSLKRRVALGAVAAVGAAGLVTIAAPAANAAFAPATGSISSSGVARAGGDIYIYSVVTDTAGNVGTGANGVKICTVPLATPTGATLGTGAKELTGGTANAMALGSGTSSSNAAVAVPLKYNTVGTDTITAGTYTFLVWALVGNGTCAAAPSAGDPTTTLSVTAAGAPASVTLASTSSTKPSSDTNTIGTAVTFTMKDAAGVATLLKGNETITVATPLSATAWVKTSSDTPTTGVVQGSASSVQYYSAIGGQSASSTNLDGTATFYIGNSAAGTATFTVVGSGLLAGQIPAATYSLTTVDVFAAGSRVTASQVGVTTDNTAYTAPNGQTSVATLAPNTSTYSSAATTIFLDPTSAKSFKVRTSGTATTDAAKTVLATIAARTGVTLPAGVTAGTTSLTLDADGYADFTVTSTAPIAGTGYKLTFGSSSYTVTYKTPTAVKVALSGTSATVATVNGGTSVITAKVTDQFGAAYQGALVTFKGQATGRNVVSGTVLNTVTTGTDGKAAYSLVDAVPTSATLTDTVNISAIAAGTSTLYVTNSSSADVTVNYKTSVTPATITLAASGYGLVNNTVTYTALAPGLAIDTKTTFTATLKDAAGGVLATGIPVVFTIKNGYALVPTTVYTTSGVASIDVYGKTTGTLSVTAASGGVSKENATITVFNSGTTDARTITLDAATYAVTGGQVKRATATVKDRYGNAVYGVSVTFKFTTGVGRFAGGSLSATTTTGLDGTAIADIAPLATESGAGTMTASYTEQDASVATVNADGLTAYPAETVKATATVNVTAAAAATATTDAATTSKINDIATAVANLSTTVAGLVASLVAQIKDTKAAIADTKAALDKLAAVVAKIQKKVKA